MISVMLMEKSVAWGQRGGPGPGRASSRAGGGVALSIVADGACVPQGRAARAGLRLASRDPARDNAVPERFRHHAGSSPMSRTVLIVDDERDVNDLLASLVQARGFQAIQRFQGATVLDDVRGLRPDLVLLD